MKKYLLLLFFVVLLFNAFAQISIQPILPLAGMVQKNNLWNIAVINTSKENYDCRLELTLRDRESGLEVITATTGLFQIGIGAKQLSASLLAPLQYNYISTSTANRRDDFIPIGNYIACYRLTLNGKVPLAEECVAFDVAPLSPPMLINPIDSAVLAVAPTQFSWIPPAPMNLFSRLGYEVVVAEIQPGQKAEEAIQQNVPFYTEPNLSINNLTYTGAAANFEKDKWYAWQVTAKDDKNYAAKSEVWVFQIRDNGITKTLNNSSYAKLKVDNNELAVAENGMLKILYRNELLDKSAKVNIVNLSNKKDNAKSVSFKIDLITGDNYIQYSLKKIMKLVEEKVYNVEITNSRGEKSSLRFIIKFTDKK